MSGRTVAIIQARMGSTRFPGKMTAPFHGQPILSWVIARLQRCTSLDDIILATSDLARDKVLIELAQEHGIKTFAGDEQNVLSRFVAAARQTSADHVVRVCADNPLIAPEAVDQVVTFFKTERPDYAYNHVPKGNCNHPDGFGAEILSSALISEILERSTRPEHFEHVTSFIWDNADDYDIRCPECPIEWRMNDQDARFDVDSPDDLQRLQSRLPEAGIESTIKETLIAWRSASKDAAE